MRSPAACSTLTGVTSCALCTDSSAGGKCTSCTGAKILSEDQSYCHGMSWVDLQILRLSYIFQKLLIYSSDFRIKL